MSSKKIGHWSVILAGYWLPTVIIAVSAIISPSEAFSALWDNYLTYMAIALPTGVTAYTAGKYVDHKINGKDKIT